MKAVLLLVIISSTFSLPSLLLGLKAKELVDSDSGKFSQTLYENLLEELNGAHLRIAATHVSLIVVNYLIFSHELFIFNGINYFVLFDDDTLKAQIPPTMIIEKKSDGTYRYSGFSADACEYLSQVFKFTCVL